MRVLVIDDEDDVRELFLAILADAGCKVQGGANGREGLELLKTQQVDLVITDILMPVLEGVETIRAIKSRHPHIRVIAISGGGRMKNLRPLEIANVAGADLTLSKPIEPIDLLSAVTSVFGAASA